MNYITENPLQTKKLGEVAGKAALKKKRNLFLLKGELGSGKTTFLQGFAKGLGVKGKVLSPTFIIFRKMRISSKRNFFHFDCYRVKNEKDILALGFKEIIRDKNNIVAVEWPERIKKILPQDSVFIEFRFLSEKKRKITIG